MAQLGAQHILNGDLTARLDNQNILNGDLTARLDTQNTLNGQLRARLDTQNTLNGQLRARSDYQETKIQRLLRSHDQWHVIRNRFLSVCKRDVLKNADRTDYRVIDNGNIVAHDGDPRSDATLYELEIRKGEPTFIALYGLRWHEVMNLSKFFTSYEIQMVYTLETNPLPSSP